MGEESSERSSGNSRRRTSSISKQKRKKKRPNSENGLISYSSGVMITVVLSDEMNREKPLTCVIPVNLEKKQTLAFVRSYLALHLTKKIRNKKFQFLNQNCALVSLQKESTYVAWDVSASVRWKHHTFTKWKVRREIRGVLLASRDAPSSSTPPAALVVSTHDTSNKENILHQFRCAPLRLQRALIMEYMSNLRTSRLAKSKQIRTQ